MKSLRLICIVSLLANVALASLLFVQRSKVPAPAVVRPAAKPAYALTAEEKTRFAAVEALSAAMKSNDAVGMRDQLRALGLPEDAVRAMLRAVVFRPVVQLQKGFTEGQRKTDNPYLKMPYGMFAFNNLTREQRAQLIEANRAAEKQLETLVGVDPMDARENRYSFLPPEKAAKMRDLERDYNEMRSKLASDTDGFRLPSDEEKFAFLESEQRKDLAALLTPEELQEYELRTSQTANRLRNQLRSFDASESEYKAIYAAQKAMDDRFNRPNNAGVPFDPQLYGQAQKQTNDQIRAALGDDRYKEYVRSRNPDYVTLEAAAKRFDLPETAVEQAYSTRDQTAAEAQRITNDSTLNDEQRSQALTNLATQTRNQLRASLGSEAADAYMHTGMRWLDDAQRGQPVTVNADGQISTNPVRGTPPVQPRPLPLRPGPGPRG